MNFALVISKKNKCNFCIMNMRSLHARQRRRETYKTLWPLPSNHPCSQRDNPVLGDRSLRPSTIKERQEAGKYPFDRAEFMVPYYNGKSTKKSHLNSLSSIDTWTERGYPFLPHLGLPLFTHYTHQYKFALVYKFLELDRTRRLIHLRV